MARRLTGVLLSGLLGCALIAAGGGAPAMAAPSPHGAVDFTGIVALDDCSGSVIKPAAAKDTDPALVLSNGHCLESGMPKPGEVIVDQPSQRTFDLLDATGQNSLGTLTATKVAYGTMTDTDISMYQVDATYADIAQKYHSKALDLATEHPKQAEAMTIPSGYWKKSWSCSIAGFVYEIKEGNWTWKDSLKYDPKCNTTHGTSGSPIIDDATHQVIGINNTGNDNGEKCTLNNPCEVDKDGKVTVHQGQSYGEETFEINGCIGDGNKVDLAKAGCTLPKPSGEWTHSRAARSAAPLR